MKNTQIVVLAKFSSIEEAQVIKALLDSTGIMNEIMNETAAQVMPYLEKDVKLLVNSEDYDRAREVLDAKFDRSEFLIKEKK